MSHSIVTLGSPPVKVLKVGHGLMFMTCVIYFRLKLSRCYMIIVSSWKAIHVPDDQAFAAIKAGLDLVSPGEKVFLNSGMHFRCLLN
jgi:hypothetical protein